MRSWAALLVWAVVPTGSGAWAASAEIKAKLSVGLGGQFVAQRWNAATLTVTNPGAPLRGEWDVALYGWASRAGPPDPLCAHSIPANLPHGESRLNFALFLPEGALNARVRLFVEGRTVLDKTEALDRSGWRPTTLVITTRPAAFASSLLKAREAMVIEPAEAPVDMRAYDAVALIVLDHPGLSALPPGARQCMHQWVLTGGTLVLTAPVLGAVLSARSESPGLSSFTTAEAVGMLPVPSGAAVLAALSGPREAQPVGGDFLLLRVPWADVRAAVGSAPLLFEHLVGAGSVRGAALDPEWMRFADTRSQLEFSEFLWGRLLQGGSYEMAQQGEVPWSLVPQGSRLGRIGWPLLVLLALALVAIGPVNWALLVRWRRKEWTVFTAPAAGALFVVVIGLVALVVHGVRPLAVHQSVNVVSAGTPGVGTFALQGLFLPASGRCDLTFPQPDAVIHDRSQSQEARRSGGGPGVRFSLGDQVLVTGVNVRQWSMRVFSSRTAVPDATVDGSLTLNEEGLSGYVESHLPVPLNDCHLVHRWNHTAIGQLLPDERKALALALGPPSVPERRLARLRALTTTRDCFENEPWGRMLTGRRRELVQEVLNWQLSYQLVDPVLIGWGPALAAGAQPSVPRCRHEEEHLYLATIPVVARGRELVVPVGGALCGLPSTWTSWFAGERFGERPDMAELPGISGTVNEFRLPLGSPAVRHQQLTVHGQIRPLLEERPEPVARVSLYDWPNRKWVTVAEKVQRQFNVQVPDPQRFVLMPAGLVRVVTGPAVEGSYVSTIWTDVSYRGEAVPQ